MTTKLKLSPLPNREVVKVSVLLPVTLRDDLLRYAQLLGDHSVAPDLEHLIPHMLASFMQSDRAFRRATRTQLPPSG